MFKMFVLHSIEYGIQGRSKDCTFRTKKCKIMCCRLKEPGVYNT